MPENSSLTQVETQQRIFNFSRLHFTSPVPTALLGFGIIMLFIALGDAVMAYFTPIFLTNNLASPLAMGLIMSAASIVGVMANVVFGSQLRGKKFSFFFVWTIVAALFFVLCFIFLPSTVPVFLLAMGAWGIYYALIMFSTYHFVEAYTQREQHAMAWGILSIFKALAYTIGPFVASVLFDNNPTFPLYGALGFYLLGALVLFIFMQTKKERHRSTPPVETKHYNVLHELKIWHVLIGRVWHLFLFVFSLSLVDATFWTVGTLLSEQTANPNEHGLVLVLYGLPSLFMGIFAGRIGRLWGKKRVAFVCGIAAGIFLMFAGTASSTEILLLFIFTASTFLAIAWPEIYAVFEDYVCRLGRTGNDFIGLQSSAIGLSAIIGPTLAGGIATVAGNQATFSVIGLILLSVSIFTLIIVPRKIRLPQSQLVELVN